VEPTDNVQKLLRGVVFSISRRRADQ